MSEHDEASKMQRWEYPLPGFTTAELKEATQRNLVLTQQLLNSGELNEIDTHWVTVARDLSVYVQYLSRLVEALAAEVRHGQRPLLEVVEPKGPTHTRKVATRTTGPNDEIIYDVVETPKDAGIG
jgi:hypothetical protein